MRSIICSLVVGIAVANGWSMASQADDPRDGLIALMPAAQPGENQREVAVPVTPVAARVAVGNGWRYRWYGGRWWYWLPENRWVYWYGDRWLDYAPSAQVYAYNYAPDYAYSYPNYSNSYPYSYYYPRYSFYYPRYYGYGPRAYVGPRVYGGYRWRW